MYPLVLPGRARASRTPLRVSLSGSDDAVEGTRLGDVDLTAMAIQAVAPYEGDTKVDAAIENGLSYLKGKMSAGTCDSVLPRPMPR